MIAEPIISEMLKRLAVLPEAEWIREMRRHFAETGNYRPEDLIRLLGEPGKGVTTGLDLDEIMRQASMPNEKEP